MQPVISDKYVLQVILKWQVALYICDEDLVWSETHINGG